MLAGGSAGAHSDLARVSFAVADIVGEEISLRVLILRAGLSSLSIDSLPLLPKISQSCQELPRARLLSADIQKLAKVSDSRHSLGCKLTLSA